jgi:ABC-type nitrate/sulfonate/bicarbonate transport system permease component
MSIYKRHLKASVQIIFKNISGQFLIWGILMLLWFIISFYKLIPTEVFPSPYSVLSNIYINFWSYLKYLIYTISASAYGLIAAMFLVIMISLIGSFSKLFLHILSSISLLSQTTPVIVIAPILAYMYGFSIFTQSLVALLIAIFPLGSACVKVISYYPNDFKSVLIALRINGYQKIRWIDGPRIIEAIISNLPLSAVLALIGSLVYEFVQPDKGIGMLIVMSQRTYEEKSMFAGAIIAICSGVMIYSFFQLIYIVYRVIRRDLADTINN